MNTKLKIPKIKIKKRVVKGISTKLLAKRLKRAYVTIQKVQKEKARKEIEELYVKGKVVFPTAIPTMGVVGVPAEGVSEREKPKEVVEVKVKGVSIPSEIKAYPKIPVLPETTEELESVDIYYPLIPAHPKRRSEIFAYTRIFWDPEKSVLIYNVTEPPISSEDKRVVEKIKKELEERLDVNFMKLGVIKARELLRIETRRSLNLIPGLDEKKKIILEYYIERDTVGLGKIEPLMRDPEIEDISCDGQRIPIYLYHRNPRFGPLRTNIMFESKDELDSFVMRLAQRCGKSISIAEPLLDGSLPDGSRVQATLGTDIARRGCNFCVKDAFVQLADGSIEDIAKLFEKFKKEHKSTPDKFGNEIIKLNGLKVLGVDETSLIQRDAKILEIIKLPPPKRLVKIQFKELGRTTSSIEVTENHKLHIVTPRGIETIPAYKLKDGMWVCVPVRMKLNIKSVPNNEYLERLKDSLLKLSNVYIKINKEILGLTKKRGSYIFSKSQLKDILREKTESIKFSNFLKISENGLKNLTHVGYLGCILREGRKGRGRLVNIPLQLSEELAYFIAWIIGDGSITKDGVSIHTGTDSKHKKSVLGTIKNLFRINGRMYNNDPDRIYINSGVISWFVRFCFSLPRGKKSRLVDVPKIIEKSPNNIIAAFLKGLFEADGCFKNDINLSTSSEKLAKKVIFLLSRLGIYALFNKGKDIFRIYVPAAYYEKFAKELKLKNKETEILIKKHRCNKTAHIMPAFCIDNVISSAKRLGIKTENIHKICRIADIRRTGIITFEKAQAVAKYVKKYSNNGETDLIEYLTNGNFEYKEILNVKINQNPAREAVYDIVCNPVNFYVGGKDFPLFLHDTIRKFTIKPLTPTHMLSYGTLNSTQLAYLWLAVEHGRSILISGGGATGKTCLLNALSLFIKPNLKILSIEDTPELRLPHTHWVPEVARAPLSIKGKVGEVTLFDLLKSSLRQRPDYIIVGEVRGREAFVLFQQMAIGHPALATIHAASIEQLKDRLITPPISLPPTLLGNIDIIIFLLKVRLRGREVRRTNEILEVVGIAKEKPVTSKIFEWKPMDDEFISVGKSKVLEDLAKFLGLTEDSIQAEVMRRRRVLEWMLERGIFEYDEISKVINSYYSNPERVMSVIEEL